MKNLNIFVIAIFVFCFIRLADADYSRYRMSIIENGGFESIEPGPEGLGAYWLKKAFFPWNPPNIPSGMVTTSEFFEGQYSLVLSNYGDSVWQFLPGVQEYADSLKIIGAILLRGDNPAAQIKVWAADNRSVVYCLEPNPDPPPDDSNHVYIGVSIPIESWTTFTLCAGKDFLNAFGENPIPRFKLNLVRITDTCYFDAFDVTSDFHYLGPEEFKEKILDEMEWTFDLWIELGLDREGPMHTPCVPHIHDALTGQEVDTKTACPVWTSYPIMIKYLGYRDNLEYRKLVIAMADLILETRHPTTGFSRYWDPQGDSATGQIAYLPFEYLWQVYDLTNDNKYKDAALEMLDTALAYSKKAWVTEPVPEAYFMFKFNIDGSITGLHKNPYQVFIRWFDLIRRLADAHKYDPKPEYLEAMEQCALLYITPGTFQYDTLEINTIDYEPTWYNWDQFDPAFDDYFGYGIQGLYRVWESYGFEHQGINSYIDKAFIDLGEVWWEALHRGGNSAGDQCRGWWPYFWAWELDPENYATHKEYFVRNGYSALKGAFGYYGSWVACTHRRWSPDYGLYSNEKRGPDGNVLDGLYMAWLASDFHPDFYAYIVSLFRTSQLAYKFDYGYIRTEAPDSIGPNIAGGEFRYINRYFKILEALGFPGIEESDAKNTNQLSENFHLHQNYPNPFKTTTTFSFTLNRPMHINLCVYNIAGQKIKSLIYAEMPVGCHSVVWDGTDTHGRFVSNGIYLYVLNGENTLITKKCILLK